jgi:hypothetical protein
MYRPIPELYQIVEDRADLVSTKKDGASPPGMTHFAPVTIATRPCKLSRSRSGEMLDVELPMASMK